MPAVLPVTNASFFSSFKSMKKFLYGNPRTGGTIVDACMFDAARANHGRRNIGERAQCDTRDSLSMCLADLKRADVLRPPMRHGEIPA
jgi:hypothetical protein